MKLLPDIQSQDRPAQQATLRLMQDQRSRDPKTQFGIHPGMDYARLKNAERRLLRRHQRDAAKKPVVGYVMLACLLALAWFIGRILWSLLSGL